MGRLMKPFEENISTGNNKVNNISLRDITSAIGSVLAEEVNVLKFNNVDILKAVPPNDTSKTLDVRKPCNSSGESKKSYN